MSIDAVKIMCDDEDSTDSNNNFDYTKLPFLGFEEIPKEIDILDNVSGIFIICFVL